MGSMPTKNRTHPLRTVADDTGNGQLNSSQIHVYIICQWSENVQIVTLTCKSAAGDVSTLCHTRRNWCELLADMDAEDLTEEGKKQVCATVKSFMFLTNSLVNTSSIVVSKHACCSISSLKL